MCAFALETDDQVFLSRSRLNRALVVLWLARWLGQSWVGQIGVKISTGATHSTQWPLCPECGEPTNLDEVAKH